MAKKNIKNNSFAKIKSSTSKINDVIQSNSETKLPKEFKEINFESINKNSLNKTEKMENRFTKFYDFHRQSKNCKSKINSLSLTKYIFKNKKYNDQLKHQNPEIKAGEKFKNNNSLSYFYKNMNLKNNSKDKDKKNKKMKIQKEVIIENKRGARNLFDKNKIKTQNKINGSCDGRTGNLFNDNTSKDNKQILEEKKSRLDKKKENIMMFNNIEMLLKK